MLGPWKLAWKYILHHWFKSLVLIASIVLTAVLPIAVKILLWQFNEKVMQRADLTPAVVGPLGSDLDLALNATYFRYNAKSSPIEYSEVNWIRETGLAQPIPIHSRYTARGYRLVGTSLDYFDFRSLSIQQGSLFATLGDCVVGSQVASQLGVSAGDQIISDRENAIGFGGQTPLKMNIAGVLSESRSPDDWAVFVDVKTAWVVAGLGHGHEDLSNADEDSGKILGRTETEVIASAGVVSFLEITDANIGSFHFHGNTDDFPLTSIIVLPQGDQEKSATLLEGRYLTNRQTLQFVRPGRVMRELMDMVFRVNRFFDANALLIALSTGLLLVLVVMLSMRLRAREMETMFRIGCSRGTIATLQIAELTIIFLVAAAIISGVVWAVWLNSGNIVESLLVN